VTPKKYVIAGNYNQYKTWLIHNEYEPFVWNYVSDSQMIRGIQNPTGVFIGTWYERPDIQSILTTLVIATKTTNDGIMKAVKFYESI
jgi:hypothetical protein